MRKIQLRKWTKIKKKRTWQKVATYNYVKEIQGKWKGENMYASCPKSNAW
jgi:hypothetical protein